MAGLWKWFAKWYRHQFLMMAAQANWLGAYQEMPTSASASTAQTIVLIYRHPIPQERD